MTLLDLFPPILDLNSDASDRSPTVSALHSGNIGDVIYSLPTARLLKVTHYILNVCTDPSFGGRVMTREAAVKLAPLLLGQGTIRRLSVIQSQIPLEFAEPARLGIDYILDVFRVCSADPTLHLAYRHALPFGIRVDGSKPWLESEMVRDQDLPTGIKKPYLVVGLTGRYRRWGDEYYATLLRNVPADRVVFVGVDEDLAHKTNIPGAYLRPTDFRQLARVLMGSAYFIGNPSFPYAVAEALKIPRFIELHDGANVAPLDPSGAPLHMYSEDYLRDKIFHALGIRASELDVLASRIETLTLEKSSLESRLIDIQSRQVEAQNRSAQLLAENQTLAGRLEVFQRQVESERYLLKALAKQVLRTNRFGSWVYGSLSRITSLRRLWRSIGRE